MPRPTALRRIALGSTAGAGVALLGFAFHGMAGLDTRLATIVQARDAVRTQMVVEREVVKRHDCPKLEQQRRRPSAISDRDY